ncbi:squalene synthase HpnC [Ignavibacterium sp.]|uniref:squalene synthase HpnC n=1 Tax=Ignavibacterium sp. TaxID=2651167 RepID=UPI00307FAB3D
MNNDLKTLISLSKKHYENFPVASFLLPKNKKQDIAIVYWFARTADDIADEGQFSANERISALDEFEKNFLASLNNSYADESFKILSDVVLRNNLNPKYFTDLISAFKQDVIKHRYKNFDEVLDYCKRSANPVGRIVLNLFNIYDEEAYKYSDLICTALQLTNFYQDIEIDYTKGRIYFPLNEMNHFQVTENMFEMRENNYNFSALLKHSINRTKNFFSIGEKLLHYLSGRLKLEIKWTIAGGEKILTKIEKNNYKIFENRPKLNKIDFISILLKSIFNK